MPDNKQVILLLESLTRKAFQPAHCLVRYKDLCLVLFPLSASIEPNYVSAAMTIIE